MAKLLIIDPSGAERVHDLVDDVTTVGRLSSNIIQVKDKEASRRHCQIERVPDGWRLGDLGSRNGVTVNGKKVKNQALRPGDRVTIGGFSIVFVAPELETVSDEELGATIEADPIDEKDLQVAPEPEAKPHYVVEVTEGRQRGKVMDLGTETLTIGRHTSNKFVIDDESGSNYHAEISKEPTGYFLTDLGSTNGTQVGGEKVVKVRLSPGAEIQIGTTKMSFRNIGGRSAEDEVFGTVVLDTDKLEKELAEDTARARAVLVRRLGGGAVAALVIAGVVWLVVWLVGHMGAPEAVKGNMIANPSFDRGLTDKGEPLGWRKEGSSLTPWEVLTDEDRLPERRGKAALRVSRSSEAALDEYTECRAREPVEVVPTDAYRVGGWIRTAGAQGAYGFRVRWTGREGRSATDQVYVMGTHADWREIWKVVTPPAWAAKGAVACFAYGNTGKVDFDDVHFVAVGSSAVIPSDLLGVGSGRISAELTVSGAFGVVSGTELAVTGGTIFVVGADEARSDLEVANADDPRKELSRAGGTCFTGSIPELSRLELIRYKASVRPGRSGVLMEYELTADRSLPLASAGVRFVVTGTFADGPMQVFDDNGRLPEGIDVPETAKELVFAGGAGEKLAVYLPEQEGEKRPRLRVESGGDAHLVEVLWPEQITLGKSPRRFAVEFNGVSRFERLPVEQAWEVYRALKEDKANLGALVAALDDIVSMADQFPEDAEKARGEREGIWGTIDREFKGLEAVVEKLG